MTDLGVLQEGRMRRSARAAQLRRARRRRRIRALGVVVVLGVAALLLTASGSGGPASKSVRQATATATVAPRPAFHPRGYHLTFASRPLPIRLKGALRAGLLFDVRTGRVLWARDPGRVLAIASLTKMMTALVVLAHSRPSDRVLITRAATHFTGSGVGLLPLGKRVPLSALLYGLMLPSGNDAAIALAQHVAGDQSRFVALMNDTARKMGFTCTHFASVSGVIDQGNYSCPGDLALLAHAVLRQPLLARVVASRSAILPFPIKGGKLFLYNNNPLLLMRYPGTDGVKTGYTVAAGSCLVVSARRGSRWFGAVLLNSANSPAQAQTLLNAAFARARG